MEPVKTPLHTSLDRPGRGRALRALVVAAVVAAGVAACSSDDSTGLPEDIGLATKGSVTGVVPAGGTSIVRFVAGRSGATRIKVCGQAGNNLDLYLTGENRSAATSSNCDSLVFTATIGTTYRVEVIATTGSGPYSFCWASLTASDTLCGATAPGYYALAEGKTGTALIQALSSILSTGTRVLGYNNARDSLYGNVTDPDNNDTIPELYVGDMRGVVRDRATALAAGLNAEHSWPQSLGANEDPANSDLNILFPADSIANRNRSNYPFGNVNGDTLYATPLVRGDRSVLGHATGTSGTVVFEPRNDVKGDVARALLYFYVRYYYNRTPSFTLANFNVEEATLIQWAKQDPPDAYEQARNELVFRAQGNRNPFIDHPEYLDAIGDFPNQ